MKRPLAIVGTLAVTVGVLAGNVIAPTVGASSHREAPSISKDPSADNTDVYAFVTPGKTDTVTLVANYIPAEEPSGGPNFYEWDPSVLYEIHIHNGNGNDDEITYQFRFRTKVVNPNTFLYNSGPISFQTGTYANWNRPQTYSVTRVDEDGRSEVLKSDALVPPVNVGPRSTPFYDDLAKAAIADLPNGGKVFAGQRVQLICQDRAGLTKGAAHPRRQVVMLGFAHLLWRRRVWQTGRSDNDGKVTRCWRRCPRSSAPGPPVGRRRDHAAMVRMVNRPNPNKTGTAPRREFHAYTGCVRSAMIDG